MIDGLIGKKINMTTSFDDDKGLAIPTTIKISNQPIVGMWFNLYLLYLDYLQKYF